MMYNYTKIKIMKKIIYLLVCSVIGLFSSCSDFLSAPSKSSFSEEIVFSNEKLTENMILISTVSLHRLIRTEGGFSLIME